MRPDRHRPRNRHEHAAPADRGRADDGHATRSPYFDTPTSYGFPSLLTAISPDGRYGPIMVTDVDQDYGVIDLTTGEFIRVR